MVKRNLNDKLKVSNGEIYFTLECLNLVTHTNFTALCYRSRLFINKFNMLEEAVMSWNAGLYQIR